MIERTWEYPQHRLAPCGTCDGEGHIRVDRDGEVRWETCGGCDGSGSVPVTSRPEVPRVDLVGLGDRVGLYQEWATRNEVPASFVGFLYDDVPRLIRECHALREEVERGR